MKDGGSLVERGDRLGDVRIGGGDHRVDTFVAEFHVRQCVLREPFDPAPASSSGTAHRCSVMNERRLETASAGGVAAETSASTVVSAAGLASLYVPTHLSSRSCSYPRPHDATTTLRDQRRGQRRKEPQRRSAPEESAVRWGKACPYESWSAEVRIRVSCPLPGRQCLAH